MLDTTVTPGSQQDKEPLRSPAVSVWQALEASLSPADERPQVVAGIEAAHHATWTGTPYVVVRSCAAGTYLKLEPREFDLLQLMDGTRTISTLVVEDFQRHRVLSPPRIAGFVEILRSHRFLVESSLDAYRALEAQLRKFDASSLLLRMARGFIQTDFSVYDVDQRLGAWYRSWGRVFFTRPAVWIGLLLALLGPVFFLLLLSHRRYPLFQTGGSYLLGAVFLTVLGWLALAIHELGHGLAVKHAGRYVHRAGVLIYYGFPAAFVDTTDIWMAPPRMRFITSLAGPYTGFVLGGICSLGAYFSPTGPGGAVLFQCGFVFFLDNLWNFCPLLETDGYYMLVDLIEKPLLRTRALAFVRGPFWVRLFHRQSLNGEEKVFVFFGLASIAFSAAVLLLAFQFWNNGLSPMVRQAWVSGSRLARGAILLALGIAAMILAFGLWRFCRRLAAWVSLKIRWLSRRAAIRLHRDALKALRSVPLWSNLPELRLLDVAKAMRAQDVRPGDEVIRQGESADKFYVIADGTFEVSRNGTPVAQLRSGDYFGERGLLNRTTRAATVWALTPGRLFWLDSARFGEMIAHDLDLRAKLEAATEFRAQVAEMPLFHDLSPTELDLLLTHLIPQSVATDMEIICEGEPGDCFYVVRSGCVEVLRAGRVLAKLGPGEAFGEIALINNIPRTATVRALEPCQLLTLKASDFHDLLAGYCGRASELERLARSRLGRLGTYDVQENKLKPGAAE
jgi:putative peptide zinc metalloprotease protein